MYCVGEGSQYGRYQLPIFEKQKTNISSQWGSINNDLYIFISIFLGGEGTTSLYLRNNHKIFPPSSYHSCGVAEGLFIGRQVASTYIQEIETKYFL